jgi:hypothetical protein
MNAQKFAQLRYENKLRSEFIESLNVQAYEVDRLLAILKTANRSDILSGKAEDVALEIAAGLEKLPANGNIIKEAYPEVQQLQNVARMYGLL